MRSSFSSAALPSINFEQDPIQYENATHHTNLDTFERVIEGDVKTSITRSNVSKIGRAHV